MTDHATNNGQHADPDPAVIALARQVERLARRQAELDGLVRRLGEDVALLLPDEPAEDEAAGPGAWLAAADPARARAALADLIEWLDAVYLRYPDAALPSCWAWHPAAVEELRWLRHAHHAAFHGRAASWRDVADWHERQRPGVVKRLRDDLGDCDLARHAPDGDRAQPPPAAPLARHLDQIAEHWTTSRSSPTPTEQQLAEAAQHDRTQIRNRR
ncbi:MAG: hypothetical protein GEV09_18860 [Pseudonocardiaceae bacterium]|nr:hypothetical protein [Pseudonocardiaceae bacterium]